MKKALLVAAALVPMLAQAEIHPGTLELNGSSALGFSKTTVKPEGGSKLETSEFALNAGGLYYLTNMIGVGAEVMYSHATDSQSGQPDVTTSTTGLAPKIGIIYGIAPNVSLFGEALVGWSWVDLDGNKADGLAWGIGGGVKLFPVSALSVDLGLRYQGINLKADQGGKLDTSVLSVIVGLSGYIGTK